MNSMNDNDHDEFFDDDFDYYDFLFEDDNANDEDDTKNIELLNVFRDHLTWPICWTRWPTGWSGWAWAARPRSR